MPTTSSLKNKTWTLLNNRVVKSLIAVTYVFIIILQLFTAGVETRNHSTLTLLA